MQSVTTNKTIISFLFAVLAVAPQAFAEGDAKAGKAAAAVCTACHAADGNSVNPEWPKLAGQHPAYLAKQLQDFKDKNRENALMAPMVANLADADMQNLAAWYASQPLVLSEAQPETVELGESIYRGGNSSAGVAACSGCHGPTGTGNPAANFPRVSGQHAKYIATQLKDFRSGARTNDAGKMMRNISLRMTDAEIEAVSQYIAGLR